ncbi:MAG: Fe-S cluster assembly protein SufD [Deltaproteobacteria bacterium]|nr:Fe-S cluster assembly protein SufD [Deltaproteobacteria bacterium]
MNQLQSIEPEWVTQNFLAFERSLNGDAHSPLHTIRSAAYSNFSRLGFPTTQNEDWKYTNLAPIARSSFSIAQPHETPAQLSEQTLARIPRHLSATTLVFVEGMFRKEYSSALPEQAGLRIHTLAEVLKPTFADGQLADQVLDSLGSVASSREHPFVALNTAFLRDGAVVQVAKDAQIAEPIQLVFVGGAGKSPSMSQPRLLVVAGENSRVTLIESFLSAGETPYLVSHVGEIVLGAGASVDHYKLQIEGEQAFHVGSIWASVARDAHFRTHSFAFGGALVRNEVSPVLNGKGGVCVLNGLSVLRAEQHTDNHTVIDHAEPNCESHELYKGIYADKSAGVFSGTIIVRPDAQKTNALQTNQSLLLSSTATIESKPQLKIWADDVKCTHGATVGQLDEHALFYLRSRGVPKKDARDMLIHAFASDVISGVRPAALKVHLEEVLTEKLASIGLL